MRPLLQYLIIGMFILTAGYIPGLGNSATLNLAIQSALPSEQILQA